MLTHDRIASLADADSALTAVTFVAAIAHLLTGAQLVAARRLFAEGALLDWRFVQFRYPRLRRLVAAGRPPNAPGGWFTLLAAAIRIGSALAILASLWSERSPLVPLVVLFVANCVITIHTCFAETAADRLGNVVGLALLLATGVGTRPAAVACLVFLAALSFLSYATAGISKLRERAWRDGTALRGVLSTATFGHMLAARATRRYAPLAVSLSWLVIAFEILFPLILILPLDLAVAALAAGVVFHLSVAVIMGLNTFVWAFASTYPAVIFVNLMLR